MFPYAAVGRTRGSMPFILKFLTTGVQDFFKL